MRVVLSTSPHVRHPAVLQNEFTPDPSVMYTFAPLGLLSLAASVRQGRPHVQCSLYDLNRRILSGELPLDHRLYNAIAVELVRDAPDVIGFMTECDSYHHILQIAAAVKTVSPTSAVVLGGPHASAVAGQTMQRCVAIDAIVIGEGEITFPALLEALMTQAPDPVAGAIRRLSSGNMVYGEARGLVANLDELPLPCYEMYTPDDGEEMFVEVGRGCPFQCVFCSTAPYWRRRHRVKSAQRILEEIRLVQRLYGTTRVHFTHDLFTTHKGWVREVCDTLATAGTPVKWTCSARTDTVDEDLLREMKRGGCDAIYFGVESGSPRILKEIHKDIPIAHTLRTVELCRAIGISANAGVIVGFPTESNQSLRETLSVYEQLLRLGAKPSHVFGYCPFADSSLYKQLTDLRCSGHFVDIPLGDATDRANRSIVCADQDLYGSYYRPVLADIVPGDSRALDGIDEFSPLVEATLYPSLALAERIGMYQLYCDWMASIDDRNRARGRADYVRRYGSPRDFASFLLARLAAAGDVPAWVLDAAWAVRTNLEAIALAVRPASTTMATHRSLPLPSPVSQPALTFETRLSLGAIVRLAGLDHDVIPALNGQIAGELDRRRTYLAWHVDSEGALRLVEIDSTTYEIVLALADRTAETAGEVVRQRMFGNSPVSRADASVFHIMDSIQNATYQGLVVVDSA